MLALLCTDSTFGAALEGASAEKHRSPRGGGGGTALPFPPELADVPSTVRETVPLSAKRPTTRGAEDEVASVGGCTSPLPIPDPADLDGGRPDGCAIAA